MVNKNKNKISEKNQQKLTKINKNNKIKKINIDNF